ncbi:hypothetical protein ACWD00_39050 [Streptomyces viridiviolaceus]
MNRKVCGAPDAVNRVLDDFLEDVVLVSVPRRGHECHRLSDCRRKSNTHGERSVVAPEARPVQRAQQVGRHQQNQSDEQDGWRETALSAAAGHQTDHQHNVIDRSRRITI